SCSWRWYCTARSTFSNGLPSMNTSWNTSKMYTCTFGSEATPSGGAYTCARAARTFSPDMRSPSLSSRRGHAAVQPVDDAHQLHNIVHVEIRARLLRVDRVPVAREHRRHAQALRAHPVALGPVADHQRLPRLHAEPAQHLAERGRGGLALAGVV